MLETNVCVSVIGSTVEIVEGRKTSGEVEVYKSLTCDSTVLSRVVSENNLRGKPAVLLLPRKDAITKRIFMPALQEESMVDALKFELRRHIPGDLESISSDYSRLDTPDVNILIAAMRKDLLTDILRLLQGAGLIVKGSVLSSLALYEACRSEHEALAIYHKGSVLTCCVISCGQLIRERETTVDNLDEAVKQIRLTLDGLKLERSSLLVYSDHYSADELKDKLQAMVQIEDASTLDSNVLMKAALSYERKWPDLVNPKKKQTSSKVGVYVCLIIVVLLNMLSFALRFRALDSRLSVLQDEIERITPIVSEVNADKKVYGEKMKALMDIDKFLCAKRTYLMELYKVSQAVPQETQILVLELEGDKICQLKGASSDASKVISTLLDLEEIESIRLVMPVYRNASGAEEFVASGMLSAGGEK